VPKVSDVTATVVAELQDGAAPVLPMRSWPFVPAAVVAIAAVVDP